MHTILFKNFFTAITLSIVMSSLSGKYAHASQPLSIGELQSLIQSCTPSGYHAILLNIVRKESSKRPLAIQINGAYLLRQPTNRQEAESLIQMLKLSDYTFDIGLAQINSQHFQNGRFFANMGYTPEDALEPCINLQMSAALIDEAYSRTGSLIQALSIYNTGSPVRGIKNGYVRSVLNQPS